MAHPQASAGSLTVVGTGIQLGVHVTPEARAAIERADEVVYLVADPLTMRWIERIQPKARSLHELYRPGRDRRETYAEMVEQILAPLRLGARVCAAFYGHPGIFVHPAHEAIARARAEGFRARVLPGISALDCLVADLGIDPGRTGLQSYEATDFVVHARPVDTAGTLVLWQVGVVGEPAYATEPSSSALAVLVDYLLRFYPAAHESIVYEASPYPGCEPMIARVELAGLAAAPVRTLSTLVIPPATAPRRDEVLAARLGLN